MKWSKRAVKKEMDQWKRDRYDTTSKEDEENDEENGINLYILVCLSVSGIIKEGKDFLVSYPSLFHFFFMFWNHIIKESEEPNREQEQSGHHAL